MAEQASSSTSNRKAVPVIGTVLLILVLLLSAVGVIYSSHSSRQLYAQLGELRSENDRLQLEFAQLLLEQSAWSSPTRVELEAVDKLRMVMPEADQIEMIK